MDSAAAGVQRRIGRTDAMYRSSSGTLDGTRGRGTPVSSAAVTISAT